MNSSLAKQYTLPSLFKFALPSMIMMLFTSLYVIIDGMFVSKLVGTTALSAINMVFPTVNLQLGLSIMIATGGSAVIAAKLGNRKEKEAKADFTALVLIEAVIGIIIALLGVIFIDEIVAFLGASEAQFEYCRIYGIVMFLFAPFYFLQLAFQTFFVTAGKPGLGLCVILIAGVTNIVLDYTFIAVFQMGILGAALATGIGYCIPSVFGILYFLFAKKQSLHFSKPRFDTKVFFSSCINGSSEMVTNLANALTTFLFNVTFMKYWGEDGVASITIILYFQFVFTAIYFGYSNGIAPIISFKYGCEDTKQLKSIYKNSLLLITIGSILSFVLSQLSIDTILTFFTPTGSNVYNITLYGFRYYAFSFLLMGISIFASALFTALSDGKTSAIISFARTLLFLVGTIMILPFFLGEIGVWLAVPVGELLGIAISIFYLLTKKKKYKYAN